MQALDLHETKPYAHFMMFRFNPKIIVSILLLSLGIAACGEPLPPVTPPAPKPEVKETAPEPPAEPEQPPEEAAKPPEKPESTEPKSSGRTPVFMSDSDELTGSFGSSPAAKLELGDNEKATLRIPEGAITAPQGVNLTFKIDSRGKSGGAQVGKIYRIIPVEPPSAAPSKVESAGAPFELTLPAGNKKDANLAVGEIVTDDKGREKVVWTVIAPKKIDDVGGAAHFEVTFLADSYLHVTTRAVSAPK